MENSLSSIWVTGQPSASVHFSSVYSVHFTNFSTNIQSRSRHISVGAGAITFCSEPEPSKKFRLLLRKRGEIIRKKKAKKQNPSCSLSFSDSHGPASVSDVRGEHIASELPRPICLDTLDKGVIRLWRHNGWITLHQGWLRTLFMNL